MHVRSCFFWEVTLPVGFDVLPCVAKKLTQHTYIKLKVEQERGTIESLMCFGSLPTYME